MVYMKQNIIAYKKFTCQQKVQRHFRTLELDARVASLVDRTHEQSLKVFIRQPGAFGIKNIFTNTKKPHMLHWLGHRC